MLLHKISRYAKAPTSGTCSALWAAPSRLTVIAIVAIGRAILYTPIGTMLGLAPLRPLYWPFLAAPPDVVTTWFVRRWGM